MIRNAIASQRAKLLLIGFVLLLGGLWSFGSVVRAQFWSKTEGTILKSTRFLCKKSSPPNEEFHVRYSYNVDNRRYESDRFAAGGLLNHDVPRPGEPDPIGDLVRKYPAGARVPVYYNPRDPSAACLDRAVGPFTWWLLGLSGTFLLLGRIESVSPTPRAPRETAREVREDLRSGPSGPGAATVEPGAAPMDRSGLWPDWMIEEIRTNVAAARQLSRGRRRSLYRIARPFWMWLRRDRRFDALFQIQDVLFEEGQVVWAHIVQANTLLFEKGSMNCPALVVFGADARTFPGDLELVADRVFALKGETHSNSGLTKIGAFLANEMEVWFNRKLPPPLTGGAKLFLTSILVAREHLPSGRLGGNFFPLLVHPEKTEAAMIVPSHFWPDELLEWWAE